MKRPRRVAVTGATGFLGRKVTPLLAEAQLETIAIGREPAAGCSSFQKWQAEDSPEEMTRCLLDADIVLHLAAHIPSNMDDPSEASRCLTVNALGTLSLALAARAAKVEGFVFVSTGNMAARQDAPVPDAAFPSSHPRTAPYYIGSKLLAETYLLDAVGDAMRVAIIRPSSIYGPGMRPGILSLICSRVQNGGSLVLNDGGRHTADYVLVDDVAFITARVVLERVEGFFNAGSGQATDLRELTRLVRELLPNSTPDVTIDPANPATAPTGFPALDVTRARTELGYRPTPIREGLRRVLREPI